MPTAFAIKAAVHSLYLDLVGLEPLDLSGL